MADIYNSVASRMKPLEKEGISLISFSEYEFSDLVKSFVQIAKENGMEIQSCAETRDFERYGVKSGKCIDDELIQRVFNMPVWDKKDFSQRKACCCVESKDIGMYDSCLHNCVYCYANKSAFEAQANHAEHSPHSPSLIGWYEASNEIAKSNNFLPPLI